MRHDNAKAILITVFAEGIGFEISEHQMNSLDLPASHVWSFTKFNTQLKRIHFGNDDQLTAIVRKLFRDILFFIDGFIKLVSRWRKCIGKSNYVEK